MNPKKKILWIEDDSDIIAFSLSPIERLGCSIDIIETKYDFDQRKEQLDQYDLILLDIILPERDHKSSNEYLGLKILFEIHKLYGNKIPIIAFTVVNNEAVNKELMKYNISNIIYKPTPINKITQKILEVLQLTGNTEEL